MEVTDQRIDNGKAFDWGRTSAAYAKYRDIYPQAFYDRILSRGLCTKGQQVLDLGTGTGVLPRNLYAYGASWIGADAAENQITEAKRLSAAGGMQIPYLAAPAEALSFPDNSFDVITACQCFWYFDHKVLSPKLAAMLRPDGRLLLLYMAWLPLEDRIAGKSEALVLQYNPDWSGKGETRHPIWIPDCVLDDFTLVSHEEYDLMVPFTRESWHGRMLACRGVGASLTGERLAAWETAHRQMLAQEAPEAFEVLHYGAVAELKPKKA